MPTRATTTARSRTPRRTSRRSRSRRRPTSRSATSLSPATDLFLGDRTHNGVLPADDPNHPQVIAYYTNSATFTLPNGLEGTFYALVQTDRGNGVFELDDANNIGASAAIAIASRPADLVVTSASAPNRGDAGGSIRMDWAVDNQGTGDTAVASWSDRVYLSTDNFLGNG